MIFTHNQLGTYCHHALESILGQRPVLLFQAGKDALELPVLFFLLDGALLLLDIKIQLEVSIILPSALVSMPMEASSE